ncbi:MAG: CueP family metal-binding protein [Deltaproteobacteria bacterium]|nr:MAG: CueP family metal-binding protein [Deltaproteobacteria bacterium]
MAQKSFQVKAVDQSGKVLVDGTVSTLRNGFFELWLPRNSIIDLTVQGFNRKARGTIETFINSNTCITTFQLQ